MKTSMNKIFQGDALNVLKTMPTESVDSVITSPPYWNLRDYGVAGQIGLEESPEKFISSLVRVFDEVRRVLKESGTLWINIGDSYASNRTGGSQGKNGARANRRFTASVAPKRGDGLKDKDLVGIPWMLAFALRSRGWYLRQDIIWHKPNPMPESVSDRCTKAHEYIFLLTKSARYFFDANAIAEESTYREFRPPYGWGIGDEPRDAIDLQKKGVHPKGMKDLPEGQSNIRKYRTAARKGSFNGKTGGKAFRAIAETRRKRSVWTVSSRPFSEAHFATFPETLIEPMVLAGCPQGGSCSIHSWGPVRLPSSQRNSAEII
jgi:DNA modification methylase